MKDDYYKILNLSHFATTSEIKSRYKVLAKKYHPDWSGDEVKMQQINEAYEVLVDPRLRYQYNKSLLRDSVKQSPESASYDTQSSLRTKDIFGNDKASLAHPKLRFQPFRTVSFVAILILALTAIGLASFVYQAPSTASNISGSSSKAQTASQTTPTNANTVTPHSTTISSIASSASNLLTNTEQEISGGENAVQACNNQRLKDYQTMEATEQEIHVTESQLNAMVHHTRFGNLTHFETIQNQYDQLNGQLKQQLAQYHDDMTALQMTGTQC